jgi:hypothetical protein
VRASQGVSPIACWQKQFAIVATLVAYGSDVNARGKFSVEDWAKIEMDDGLAEVLDMLNRARPPRSVPPPP